MALNNNFPIPNRTIEMTQDWMRKLIRTIENNVNGKTNNTGEVTIDTGAATTTVDNLLCNENSVVLLVATTANAAAEVASGFLYVAAGDKSFVIHHTNSATAGRTFRYIIVG